MYRPPSVRNFKSFIGELTAEAAATHVSLLESQKMERKQVDYWTSKASEVGIVLNGITSDRILNSQIRLSIVSIYSGFDVFLDEVENEFKRFDLKWMKPDKVSPLEVLEKNYIRGPDNKKNFRYESNAVDYLRLLRNSIAHPNKKNKDEAENFYKSRRESIDFVREKYNMLSAPNNPSSISFHDIKFWCRLLLDFSESIALLLEPDDERIYSKVPFDSWKKYGKNHDKLKKVAISYIHSEYSYSLEKAKEIVEKFYDSLT
ncbi:hypothetical protein [Beggiatoa leptomitoformis]|uniref:Uncharacterized protein n=1 Tax=Beggiatoa leptomitoformis TaxID=288004 RepID=A0A2N9YCZ7_9GAMM|nr:hypothetical protein [Beggiatoa leptomitoformis]ALG69225.1 hypothetical protein AL038_17980 [Beggiatoa leptomitoformis]AUI68339.1 hypothetical protein BLE401_06235 [Beggiatoa leptomitoformis]